MVTDQRGQTMMRFSRVLALISVALVLSALLAFSPLHTTPLARAASNTITNGPLWQDTSGNQIEAYGSSFYWVNGTFYWLGLDFSQDTGGTDYFHGINCYSSSDLVNWTKVGQVLAPQASGDLATNGIVEGDRVIYNSSTHTYVMWLHIDNTSYSEGKVGVATSSSICGTYTYNGSTNALGNYIADSYAWVDSDNTGYLLGSTRQADGSYDVNIYKLSADYLSVQSVVATVGQNNEAPVILKANGVYYLLSSSRTGWSTNPNTYATATNLAGPWSAQSDVAPHATNTWDTQTQNIISYNQGGQTLYIYVGGRWNGNDLNDSRYIWLPMTLNSVNRTMSIPSYYQNWQLSSSGWSGSPNLAAFASVSASSDIANYGWSASYVDDTRENSEATTDRYGWSSTNTDSGSNHTEWIQVNLGSSQTVDEVDLYPRNDSGEVGQGFPVDFTIQVASDSACSNWTTVVTETGYPQPGNSVQPFDFSAQSVYCVKVVGTNLRPNTLENNAYYMQLAEFEVYDR